MSACACVQFDPSGAPVYTGKRCKVHRGRRNWEVWQNGRAILSNLTRYEAENKVWNERRGGWHMEARQATA